MLPLQRIHPDSTYIRGAARISLEYWRKQTTETIVRSLARGQVESLKTKADGRVMNGNTRIKVLEERAFDVNSLEREEI